MAKVKTQKQIDDLVSKHGALQLQLNESLDKLKEQSVEIQGLKQNYSEMASVQTELHQKVDQLTVENEELKERNQQTASQLESLEQYSRKFTLILTGEAVPEFQQGEDTRDLARWLLFEHVGIEGLNGHSLTACHRLRGPKSILIRFRDLEDRQRVYLKRTRPARRGVLVFESLTPSRAATTNILRSMHKQPSPPFVSFWTMYGTIYVKVKEGESPRTVDVGATEDQIRAICSGTPQAAVGQPASSRWLTAGRGKRNTGGSQHARSDTRQSNVPNARGRGRGGAMQRGRGHSVVSGGRGRGRGRGTQCPIPPGPHHQGLMAPLPSLGSHSGVSAGTETDRSQAAPDSLAHGIAHVDVEPTLRQNQQSRHSGVYSPRSGAIAQQQMQSHSDDSGSDSYVSGDDTFLEACVTDGLVETIPKNVD